MTDLDSIDPAFGHWLAGFVDGEGCFTIGKVRKTYQCIFVVTLRDDDWPILDEAQRRTGLGHVRAHYYPKSPGWKEGGNPQAAWWVSSRPHCNAVVDLFTRFPLRAKKARDFRIWTEAIAEWNRVAPGQGCRTNSADWSRMGALKDQLHAVRAYAPDADTTEPTINVAPYEPLTFSI